MQRQQHSSHEKKAAFACITDSAADIADDALERLDIHMVPARIQFGDRGYLDKVSISSEEFFHELETNPVHPTSSQPAPGDFRRQYQFLASHFRDVISVNLSLAVSGTWQAAKSAAERTSGPGRYTWSIRVTRHPAGRQKSITQIRAIRCTAHAARATLADRDRPCRVSR